MEEKAMVEPIGMLMNNIIEGRDGFYLGEVWKYSKNAKGAIIPIIRDKEVERDYVTLPEVKDKVQFSDTGHINKAGVKGVDKPLFIRIGSILEGVGTQSRGVEHSVIVMPEGEEEIDVKCVHASHPISYGSQFAYCGTAPKTVEHAFLRGGSQSAVWESVSNTAYQLSHTYGAASNIRYASQQPDGQSLFTSDNLASIKKEAKQFDDLTKKILDEVPTYENQVGAIIFSLAGIEGIELYNSPKSWEAQHKEVIEKYSGDIGAELSDVFSLDEVKAMESAITFLRQLNNASTTLIHSNGGKVYQITTEGYTGEFTIFSDEIIHLVAVKSEGKENQPTGVYAMPQVRFARPDEPISGFHFDDNTNYTGGEYSTTIDKNTPLHFDAGNFARTELLQRKGMDSVLRTISLSTEDGSEGKRWKDIFEDSKMSSATVSKRLKEAKGLGLVREDLQKGKKVYRLTTNGEGFVR